MGVMRFVSRLARDEAGSAMADVGTIAVMLAIAGGVVAYRMIAGLPLN